MVCFDVPVRIEIKHFVVPLCFSQFKNVYHLVEQGRTDKAEAFNSTGRAKQKITALPTSSRGSFLYSSSQFLTNNLFLNLFLFFSKALMYFLIEGLKMHFYCFAIVSYSKSYLPFVKSISF